MDATDSTGKAVLKLYIVLPTPAKIAGRAARPGLAQVSVNVACP